MPEQDLLCTTRIQHLAQVRFRRLFAPPFLKARLTCVCYMVTRFRAFVLQASRGTRAMLRETKAAAISDVLPPATLLFASHWTLRGFIVIQRLD